MKVIVTLAAILLLGFLAIAEGKGTAPTQLQIGVKFRPEDCTVRTKPGDKVSIHYTGTLFSDGTEFDTSLKRGKPLEFILGSGQVIKGWDQGLLNMCVGEKRKLKIPSDLAYGARGAPPAIPANAALVFETELMAINDNSSHDEL
ncbi:Peptidyl-prolyl cis-trans isomerase fpr2 [Coemansia brasiliensis]|uniref:peptidylprolyl isomerase n=1 Tax=Coemansia brasiliensis TaxID=2650707 RepID=A0A9W8I8R8_9FUNG|nr:Peptidyl-prolyl cis-trans isomerase fpr2 [Coemansia brasiliensis]